MIICFLSVPKSVVCAESSTISMTVPDEHKIMISAEHAAAIYQDEVSLEYAGEDEKLYMVERFSEPVFELKAKDGYKITKVLLDEEDVTSRVKDGFLTLPPVDEDHLLTLETEAVPEDDKKDDGKGKDNKSDGTDDGKKDGTGSGTGNTGNGNITAGGSGAGGKNSQNPWYSEGNKGNHGKKIKAAVTGDVTKCGVMTCVLLAATAVAAGMLKRRNEG